MQVFAERGFKAASLDEIARRAGVTKPVVYRHAASKTELYVALLEAQIEELLTRVAAAIDPAAPPEDRLRAGIEGFFGYVAERPFAQRLLFRDAEAEPAVQAAHERAQGAATRAIAALLASEPALMRDEPDRLLALELFAEAIKTGLNGLAAWWWAHPEVPAEVLVDRATHLFWRGLHT